MFFWRPWFKQITPVFFSILCVVLYESVFKEDFISLGLIKNLFFVKSNKGFYSSVSCRGNNHTERLCKFKNLCYEPVSQSFLFFHNLESLIIGIPKDRFSPALTDFSSVYDHNTQYFNFIDLPDSAISNFSINFVKGLGLLFKRFNPDNLMHVFHDDLIPAFVTLNEISFFNEEDDVFFVFADGREPGPYADLYGKFLRNKPLFLNSVSSSSVICFEKVVIGLNKQSLWYQYGFKQPQGPLNKDMSSIFPVLINFRKYISNKFELNIENSRNTALLLSRSQNRKILNTAAVAKTIESITKLKTVIISLENNSVIEIIEKVMRSKLIVGMHGSLLILSLFLPENSFMLELFPFAISPDICTPYKTLASIHGLKIQYHSWENNISENSYPHPEYPAELGGIHHLPEQTQSYIKNSYVKPFLCCYNPEWLYRIYQDTIVDLESFSTVLTNAFKTRKKQSTYNSTSILTNQLYPSEVQNISCKLTRESKLSITWEKPWNVNFINAGFIEYELWYQDNEKNDVKAFIMQKTYFTIPFVTTNIYIWIRCHLDGRLGPFNTDPTICQE